MARKNGFVSGYTDSNITYHYVGYQIIGESPVREFHGLSWTECYRLMNYYYWAESYQYCQDDGTCQLYVTPITNPEDFR
ncbi:hypothetical protein [Marinifilum sp.]|uniref:hypothetical protein n=1 Tax=Marinifilum sp. TaxID=2033137 RepID=UPI003BA96BAC